MKVFLFSVKYFLFNRKKVHTAYICIAITVLLITLILCISNGVESYLLSKYKSFGKSFIILNTNYYTPEFLEMLSAQSEEIVQYFVCFDDLELQSENVVIKNVIASNTERRSFLNGKYFENKLVSGRFFNEYEKYYGDHSVIVEEQFAKNLIGKDFVIGQSIMVLGESYQIVGTVQDHSISKIDDAISKIDDGEKRKEQLKGCVYIPFSVLTEEQLAKSEFTYYLQFSSEKTKEVQDLISKELIRRHVTTYQFTSSSQVDEDIRNIKDVIRAVLIVLSLFSVLTGILILISTIRLIVIDLQPVLLFLKVQGVSQCYINCCIFTITGIVSFTGVLIGVFISLPFQICAQLVFGLQIMLQWQEYLFFMLLSLFIAIISFPANLRQLNHMKVMYFFRS